VEEDPPVSPYLSVHRTYQQNRQVLTTSRHHKKVQLHEKDLEHFFTKKVRLGRLTIYVLNKLQQNAINVG
jgi:hypothetical protein